MTLSYKLVGFDRQTDRLAVAHEIPESQVERAKELAGIADNPAIIADWPLSAAQAAAVARLIDRPIDPARYEYTLEPYSQQLHTITGVKAVEGGRLNLGFDEGGVVDVVLIDLSPLLAQGGVFQPLRDPKRFAEVQIGPGGRTLIWHVGEDVVDLCADALWLMAHPDRAAAAK